MLPTLTAAAIVAARWAWIGQVHVGIAGDERQLVLLDERAEQALALEAADLPVEQLETGKAELGHVLEYRLVQCRDPAVAAAPPPRRPVEARAGHVIPV